MRVLAGLACWRTSFLSAKITLENRSRRKKPLCEDTLRAWPRAAGRRSKRSASRSVEVLCDTPSCSALVK